MKGGKESQEVLAMCTMNSTAANAKQVAFVGPKFEKRLKGARRFCELVKDVADEKKVVVGGRRKKISESSIARASAVGGYRIRNIR